MKNRNSENISNLLRRQKENLNRREFIQRTSVGTIGIGLAISGWWNAVAQEFKVGYGVYDVVLVADDGISETCSLC